MMRWESTGRPTVTILIWLPDGERTGDTFAIKLTSAPDEHTFLFNILLSPLANGFSFSEN